MRIEEVAKRYKLSNDLLIGLLRAAGFKVSAPEDAVTDAMLALLEEKGIKPKSRVLARPVRSKVTAKAKASVAKAAAKAKAKVKVKAKAKAKAAPKKAKAKAKAKAAPKKAKAKAKAKAAPKKAKAKVKAKAAPKAKAKAKAKAEPKAKAKAAEPRTAPKAQVKAAPEAKPAAAKAAPKPKAAPPAKAAPQAKPAAPPKTETRQRVAPKPGQAKRDKAPSRRTPEQRSSAKPATAQPRRKAPARSAAATEAQKKLVRESVRRTLAKIETTRRTKRRKSKPREATSVEEAPIKIAEGTTIRELAEAIGSSIEEIMERCQDLGLEVTETDSLDRDTVEIIADDIGRKIDFVTDEIEELLRTEVQIDESRLAPRAPIVTVMGHVDHGKTSILDFIRKTRVASGEAGGITQHIGAYQVDTPGGSITFIDTPGHEAFTSMRARGARVTDIVVLVVAADDGVMPQTVEAINHAKAGGVPIIVCINKMDLPGVNPAQIKQQLTESDVVVEDFGGEVVSVEVSAKTGDGIDKLLEMILLQAEVLELKADPGASAQAVAVEVKKEEGRGVLCTVLVTQGTLKTGDVFVIGSNHGKVRALLDHTGKPVKEAGPSKPVIVLGTNDTPVAGDRLTVVKGEREARELSERRQEQQKIRALRPTAPKLTLEELYSQIQQGEVKELRLIVRGDTNGTVEALTESLNRLAVDEVSVKVIHSGVGVIAESDILLAASSQALIIGFNTKVSPKAQELADRENVEIKTYSIIYEVIEEVDKAMKGMLEPERVERVIGRAEVRQVFNISKLGRIAGSYVIEGEITRNAHARVLRADDVVYEGRITSLKRFQDDVREVQNGFECGIGVGDFGDLAEGDIVEAYVVEEKERVF